MLVMRATMANAIVGQFLPRGAILKGGGALRFRYGNAYTRNTIDFDTTRRGDLDTFLEALRSSLEVGWNGFTGQIVILPQASPKGVPVEYVMQPVDVKLRYKGQSWCTVNVEISHDEAGASNVCDYVPPPEEVRETFHQLGFPDPAPVALMTLEHQMAQKIHAVSNPSDRNQRAHDLIDLQVIMKEGNVNLSKVREICQRLFPQRRMHTWPTPITIRDGWDTIYNAQKRDLNVLGDVKDAVVWANELITLIDKA
ncbi:MAG: nucleotidyl transferase AbiEii/AbiGii toxin family protein [Kiritimatiellae bacterium]|nr:nucleotidyl transferase AbiEii/AbiGii toxin family protein [Kiritimatiellia bacterium]